MTMVLDFVTRIQERSRSLMNKDQRLNQAGFCSWWTWLWGNCAGARLHTQIETITFGNNFMIIGKHQSHAQRRKARMQK